MTALGAVCAVARLQGSAWVRSPFGLAVGYAASETVLLAAIPPAQPGAFALIVVLRLLAISAVSLGLLPGAARLGHAAELPRTPAAATR